jgi:hypothetical protein
MEYIQRYIPPNLRQPLREAGALGYSLLDNVVGLDDNFDSAGEQFGRAVRQDPVGMARAMGSGLLSSAQEAIMHPIDTARGVVQDVAGSFSRAARGADAYLPEGVDLKSATMDQMRAANDAYLADMVGVAGAVPAARLAGGAARAAGRGAVDISQRIEVDPNALGSMGGNIRFKPQASIEDHVAAARKAVIDSPNDENLFLEYKRLRKMRDEGVSTFPQAEAPAPQVSSGLLGDYVGQHRAPTRDAGAPAFNLAGDIYPDDIYSSKAVQYYGTGSDAMDRRTMGLLQSLRGKPDADVTIYRAVPKGVDNLNAGDWVTVSKQYAKDHGESALGGDFDIIEKKVKAKDIFTNGDSIHEFGYDPALRR